MPRQRTRGALRRVPGRRAAPLGTRQLVDDPTGEEPKAGQSGARQAAGSDAEGAARQVILRQLARAPRTRAQLAVTLFRRGFPEETVERVLDQLSDEGLIDDEAFARAWVESRHAGRGLARRALSYELRARGIEEDTATSAVTQLSEAQEEHTARELVRRRLRATVGEDTQIRIRRVASALARKGYSAGLAYRLIKEALEAENVDANVGDLADPAPDAVDI
jgi:regulatory protein